MRVVCASGWRMVAFTGRGRFFFFMDPDFSFVFNFIGV